MPCTHLADLLDADQDGEPDEREPRDLFRSLAQRLVQAHPEIAWLHQYWRLRIRYQHRDDIHKAFLAIGCSLICLKLLEAEGSLGKAL